MEDDGEIEYLDEDEEIVQQCVQTVQTLPVIQDVRTMREDVEEHITPLLVERKPVETKRKHVKTEDDSDYDPTEDLLALQRKKKKITHRKGQLKDYLQNFVQIQNLRPNVSVMKQKDVKTYENKLKNLPNLTVKKKVGASVNVPTFVQVKEVKTSKPVKKEIHLGLSGRRKLDIRIPDYEDPLCLPVRAIKRDQYDLRKLKLWNNLCLEQFKKCDGIFKPDKGEAVSSTRTIVLRNVKNKNTGKMETTVWGKNTVENEMGEKKSESFQNVLPKYKEKIMLSPYALTVGQKRQFKHTFEAVLCKEEVKDEQSLVVYKPKDAVSAVYRFMENNNSEQDDEAARKRVLREVACSKLCAPCFQLSWRGVRKRDSQDNLKCRICKRSFISVYNLLTHIKSGHSKDEVRRQKGAIARTLASVVDYHYKCRICQEQFLSIKMLRKHVSKHQGTDIFKCEIGNHMTS